VKNMGILGVVGMRTGRGADRDVRNGGFGPAMARHWGRYGFGCGIRTWKS